jgi:sugar phosphate isomerase/epimerase
VATVTVHPRLGVSGVCTYGWPFEGTVAFWQAAGIARVGLPFPSVVGAGLDRATERIDDANLQVVDVIDLSPFHLHEPQTWPAAREKVEALIEASAALGSPSVMLSSGWAGALPWDQAASAFVAAYTPLAAMATAYGMRLSFENSSPLRPEYGFASTLADTAELAASVGGGVCLEISNCWGERGLERTVADHVDRIDVVQLSDFVLGTGRTPDRAVPGDGCIPLGRIVSAIEAAGYRGPYELELIGPRIEAEGPDRATLRGLQALSELFVELGVNEVVVR